jgi:hypothetical protein
MNATRYGKDFATMRFLCLAAARRPAEPRGHITRREIEQHAKVRRWRYMHTTYLHPSLNKIVKNPG